MNLLLTRTDVHLDKKDKVVVGKDSGCRVYRMKSVYLDSDMAVVVVVVCGGIRLDDQRWTDRQHGVYQAAGGEDQMVCPYSQQVRDLQFPRLFPVYHVTTIHRCEHSLPTLQTTQRLLTYPRTLACSIVLWHRLQVIVQVQIIRAGCITSLSLFILKCEHTTYLEARL